MSDHDPRSLQQIHDDLEILYTQEWRRPDFAEADILIALTALEDARAFEQNFDWDAQEDQQKIMADLTRHHFHQDESE